MKLFAGILGLWFTLTAWGGLPHESAVVSRLPQSTNRFVYDGWLLLAEMNSANAPVRSYVWGLDVSGSSPDGPLRAGGIGGLLAVTVHSGANAGTYYRAADGRGNVAALVNAANGQVVAQYGCGPFGELLRASGPLARQACIVR